MYFKIIYFVMGLLWAVYMLHDKEVQKELIGSTDNILIEYASVALLGITVIALWPLLNIVSFIAVITDSE